VHELTVRVYSSGSIAITDGSILHRSDSSTVVVVVDDVNDNSPVFSFPSMTNHTVHVSKATTQSSSSGGGEDTVIAQVIVKDADIGINARLTYSIEVQTIT